MLESEILEKMKGLSIEERIRVIEAIWRTINSDMRSSVSPSISEEHPPLCGKVIHYEDLYEPIAAEDWKASA